MLDKNALSQLSQLKVSITSEKYYLEGVVRSTHKRFGFVALDDGRDAFLDPDQMQKVLPGDRVRVSITENDKKQLNAELDELITSHLQIFVGRYVKKGPSHFVEPDIQNFSRWLFIPPHERTNCNSGDLVQCQIIRHPFHHDGKVQVKIINRIGRPEEAGIEADYILAKYQLSEAWNEAELGEVQRITQEKQLSVNERKNLTHLPFVTIDSEFTRDMDDAIFIEETDSGWQLISAIADPSLSIHCGSTLDLSARQRASTLYLLGHPVTMLPCDLSHNTYSLIPNEERPVITCHMQIRRTGAIDSFVFHESTITSKHKLNYLAVSQLVKPDVENTDKHIKDQNDALPDTIKNLLHTFKDCALARMQYRKENCLVMDDRADFQYWLNDQRKIERIEKRQRNIAQRMIEEAMLATNICAGDLFSKNPGKGIYSSHAGFRAERIQDIKLLIEKFIPDYPDKDADFSELNHYKNLFRFLYHNISNTEYNKLLSLLQRTQQGGTLSTAPIGHFALGFKHYAMVTSPIRRYQDLYNHYTLKTIIRDQAAPINADKIIASLQTQITQGRQASRLLERWLLCQYLSSHIGSVHVGTVRAVNSKGIVVHLNDIGTEGFVMLAGKGQAKPKFNSGLLTLITEAQAFSLDQTVTVTITSVDINSRSVDLELVDQETADRLRAWTEPQL